MLTHRPRRLRSTDNIRDMVAETVILPSKLIMPHFVCEGSGIREGISSMPGIDRVSIDSFIKDVEADANLGIRALILFGIPAEKDEDGTGAYDSEGIVQKAIRAVKKAAPDVTVISDVCLCEYTSHGHCGIVHDGQVLNDPTLNLLGMTALSHAQAGADIVAPSDMMDGRVARIRHSLDDNGFPNTPIMAYSAKYSSAFYGPFRDAAGSAPQFGDRRSYQMDCRNAREAEREVSLDLDEGADIVMVKPALSYLDIIYRTKMISDVPVCAYNVSGEYGMVKAAAETGRGDERALTLEVLTSIFRAGADMIISYHTRELLKNKWL